MGQVLRRRACSAGDASPQARQRPFSPTSQHYRSRCTSVCISLSKGGRSDHKLRQSPSPGRQKRMARLGGQQLARVLLLIFLLLASVAARLPPDCEDTGAGAAAPAPIDRALDQRSLNVLPPFELTPRTLLTLLLSLLVRQYDDALSFNTHALCRLLLAVGQHLGCSCCGLPASPITLACPPSLGRCRHFPMLQASEVAPSLFRCSMCCCSFRSRRQRHSARPSSPAGRWVRSWPELDLAPQQGLHAWQASKRHSLLSLCSPPVMRHCVQARWPTPWAAGTPTLQPRR